MRDSDFTKLMKQTNDATWRATILQNRVSDEFKRRYGTTYSDADLDDFIDIFDYGSGDPLTAAQTDRLMEDHGFPRIDE